MKRRFNVTRGNVASCPKCDNSTEFVGRAERCAEDCCDCWVECKCGYDPTADDTGHRLEDVWGEVSNRTIPTMLKIWNERIAAQTAAKASGQQ